jgi:hypothetical protein
LTSFLRTYADPAADLQHQSDVAVVISTIIRPSLVGAVQSIFAQDFGGRIQVLIGVDKPLGSLDLLDAACANRPARCVAQVIYPGYSTSVRHGGVTQAGCGGALRCMLSLMANSPYVAYLDDDNWFHPAHLGSLRSAVDHAQWAYSLRWFVHPQTLRPICVDTWESVGPGRGLFNERFGGFVDTNCLLINKQACEPALMAWNTPIPGDPAAMSEDRMVFDALRRGYWSAGTNRPTVFYRINETDGLHPIRLRTMGDAYAAAGAAERAAQ